MRIAVFILTGLYVALYAWAWFDTAHSHMDAAGRGMAMGFLVVGMGFTALFTIPATILAALDKAPKWALGLALVPAAAVMLLLASGMA